jgi:hypothetical protein
MTLRSYFMTARALLVPGFCIFTGSASAQIFGPDAYGYTGNRTNAPGAFSSIKGAGGTLVTPADPAAALYDDWNFSTPIGFAFPIYGGSETTAFLSTNGLISFGGTTNTSATLGAQVGNSYNNGNLASASPLISGGTGGMQVDRTFIAPWWDDMQFTNGQAGGLYTLTRTVGAIQEFVVEWNNVAFFNATTNGVTFQSILRSDGTISFYYPDVTNGAGGTNAAQATIGMHNLGGTTANNNFLQYSFNQAGALLNGDRIDITPVPEPGSLLLLGVAGLGCLVRRRRVA